MYMFCANRLDSPSLKVGLLAIFILIWMKYKVEQGGNVSHIVFDVFFDVFDF